MSNNYQNWEDDEEFDFEDEDQPAQRNVNDPSKLIKDLRKQLKQMQKEKKDLETTVSEFNSQKREKIISEVLAERGVNPKIAKLIPAEVDASNADALNAWLEEYGDAFGIPQGDNNGQDLSGLKRINSATTGADIPSNADDIQAMIDNASTEEELYNILQQLG